jgi:uncharacterized protein YegL
MFKNKKDLIDGFNNLLLEQQAEKSTNLLTVITFNHKVEIFKEEIFPKLTKIEGSDIITGGSTSLIDAVGEVYDMILNNDNYKNITLTVITDGQENSSINYTIDNLNERKKLIDKNYNLNMIFIGANISCISDNEVNTHASYRVNCSGNIRNALRIASRNMSSGRENSQYVPEETVEQNHVTPLVIKRSFSSTNKVTPGIKRCKTFCKC